MKPEWIIKKNEQLVKQYNAGFLEVVDYPECLLNIVSVPKKDRNVGMCVD